MRKILFISTGGTIASRQTKTGLMPALDGAALFSLVPQIAEICHADCVQLFCLDSSNIQPHHWTEIADKIVAEYENYDGFVISHGTDTMAYTSSALSAMLKGIAKPVVLTGSQLPMEDAQTDGKRNLLNAFRVAAGGYAGVWIVFADSVIKGDCARKLYTRSLSAFESVNEPAAAKIEDGGIIWRERCGKKPCAFTPKTAANGKVFVYTLIPGASPAVIDFAVQSGYSAIVIEAFGSGGIPGENSLLDACARAIKAGVKVVCVSQCPFDGADMQIYDVGVRAAQAGIVSGGKKTLEAVVTELICEGKE